MTASTRQTLIIQYETDGGVRIAGGHPLDRRANTGDADCVDEHRLAGRTVTLPPPYFSIVGGPGR